jgi:hypothetical protein
MLVFTSTDQCLAKDNTFSCDVPEFGKFESDADIAGQGVCEANPSSSTLAHDTLDRLLFHCRIDPHYGGNLSRPTSTSL